MSSTQKNEKLDAASFVKTKELYDKLYGKLEKELQKHY